MSVTRSGNIIGLLLVLVVLLLLAYWYLQPASVFQESPPAVNQSSVEFKAETQTLTHKESIPDGKAMGSDQSNVEHNAAGQSVTTKIPGVKQNLTLMGTPAEAAEVKQWFMERGNFYASEDTEYKNYDESTLRTLANGGDIRALHELADRYIYGKISGPEGHGVKATNELFWKAAVYGSTEALSGLALNKETLDYSDTGPERENRQHALEILSLYNTAALRGDEWPNLVNAKDFKFLNHINLSDDEKKYIEQRSQEIYNDLLQKRIELGLGDFDNSQPESVKKYFARLRAVEGSN
jgi:hypothetical protein